MESRHGGMQRGSAGSWRPGIHHRVKATRETHYRHLSLGCFKKIRLIETPERRDRSQGKQEDAALHTNSPHSFNYSLLNAKEFNA